MRRWPAAASMRRWPAAATAASRASSRWPGAHVVLAAIVLKFAIDSIGAAHQLSALPNQPNLNTAAYCTATLHSELAAGCHIRQDTPRVP